MAASNIGHNVDVSSLESQPRTHETIADKIAHHYRCIYDLRTQWNDLSPISALPPEVLAEIFLHVAGIRASNIHSRLPYIDEWIYVSHVCRRWRFVALGCPALWSRLTVKGPASCQWLPEFLARSNQVSLSMAISFETHSSFGFGTPLPEELISIALSSLRRMRTLKIDAAPGYSPEIMKLLEGPAPLLEDLYISETKPSGILDPLNQLLRCPETCRLRRLDLKCPVDWAGISLSGLTRLSVGSSYRVMKLDAFLAALAQMPRLEELATDGAFIPNYYGEAHTPSLPTPAHLPRIRTLRIWRETAAQCACILRSMETPALAQLSVNAIPRGSVASQIELFAASAAKAQILGRFLTLAIVHDSKTGYTTFLRAYRSVPDSAATDPIEDATVFWLDEHTPVLELSCGPEFDEEAISALCQWVPIDRARCLILQGSLPSEKLWPHLVDRTALVTEVRLFQVQHVRALPAMLVRRCPEGECSDPVGHINHHYALPRLRLLTLDEVSLRGPISKDYYRRRFARSSRKDLKFIDALLDSFVERYENGAEIERLRLLDPQNAVIDSDISKMEEVVRLVEWNGGYYPYEVVQSVLSVLSDDDDA